MKKLSLSLLALAALLTGCEHIEPLPPREDGNLKSGPGLFTGEKGAFIISPSSFSKEEAPKKASRSSQEPSPKPLPQRSALEIEAAS